MYQENPLDPGWFRFTSWELDAFCDGTWHCLEQGVDFPAAVTMQQIRRRLQGAAGTRFMSINVTTSGTRICFRFLKDPRIRNSGPLFDPS